MTEQQIWLAIEKLGKKLDDLQGSVVDRLDALIMLAEKCLSDRSEPR